MRWPRPARGGRRVEFRLAPPSSIQQAARVAENTGFFLNGKMVEFDSTHKIFTNPKDKRTEDYITGRFG